MGRRKKIIAREPVSALEIPADVIGAVVIADLQQIETDAGTHPDQYARRRIIRAVCRLREIATGKPAEALAEILAEQSGELAAPEPEDVALAA